MRPYDDYNMKAPDILDAVEQWSYGYIMTREIETTPGNRLDAVMVPASQETDIFKRHRIRGLVGIEVKVTPSDFRAGLKSGQFERYEKDVAGLYIATLRDTCKTSEIPGNMGHLICASRREILTIRNRSPLRMLRLTCVCRRHPAFKEVEIPQDVLWKFMFRAFKEMNETTRKERRRVDKALKKFGAIAGHHIMSACEEILKGVENGLD